MKKLYFILGLSFLIQQSEAVLDLDRPEAKPNIELSSVQSAIRTIDDFFGTERLGFQALKLENEQFIRNIINSLKMDDYCIEIRGMSNFAQRVFGRLNACVVPSRLFSKKSHAYMFISEEWFESLTESEKQALIRHELMHLKYDHGKRTLRFVVISAFCFGFMGSMIKSIMVNRNYPCKPEDRLSYITADAVPWLFYIPWFMAIAKYSRLCEQEADVEAAKTMENKQGFVDLFNNFKVHTEDPDSKFAIKRFFDRLGRLIGRIGQYFSTHPTLDERIEYIQNLEIV